MLIAWNFFDSLAEGLTGLLLMLDGIVYWIISLLFGMFEELAKFEFLTQDTYQEIVNRFLVVLGVVMLFYLAYALLKALVNPDELKNSSKIVTNLVISLILLNIVPVIFNYSYELQNIIIDENVVGKIVLGNGTDNIASVGKRTAMQFLEAFLRPGKNAKIDGYDNWEHLKACILDNQLKKEDGITDLCQGNEGFRHITLTSQSIVSGDTEYIFIISTICGAFLVYVIASFCLDLGIRVVKLAFYQIISPIPIMMRIIPEKKSVFDNWVKATLATYLEVFIRLFVMYLISFLFTIIPDIMSSFNEGDLNIFGTIVVLMGLFAFAKQAPKLIGDVMGLDAGNLKLGIKDKLATGGAFAAGAAIGGGATAMVRNLTHGAGNVKNAQGFKNKAKAIFGVAGGTLTGAVSGAARSGYGARNAQNVGDMRNAASAGVNAVTTNRDNREAYRASHGGTTSGVVTGHISDALARGVQWTGINPLNQLEKEQGRIQEVADARKALNDRLTTLMELSQNERSATVAQTVAGIGTFNNLTELQAELEHMKSSGKTLGGGAVTANQIRQMQQAEDKLKKQLKTDIINGLDKNGTLDMAGYDGNLKELLISYRSKSRANYNTIAQNIDRNNNAATTSLGDLHQVIDNRDMSIDDFITTGIADTIFNQGNTAINNANSQVGVHIAESERNRNSGNSGNS